MKRYIKSNEEFPIGPTHPAIAGAKLTPAMIAYLGGIHRHYKAGDNMFNILHAYLQGLEDAGVITDKEHGDIFAEVMEIN